MMRRLFALSSPGIFLLTSICFSQVASPYEVGTWQGFRSGAMSYTFDGLQLTLFAVTNPSWAWPANWSGLQNAASQGHEIASHTVTHTSFSGMVDSVQENELRNSQNAIESHIAGRKCATIAYPYCNTGNSSLVRRYHFAARGCSGAIEPKTPSNFMNISSIICGSQGSVKTSADFKSKADNAATAKGWCVYLIHGINGNEPGAYSPIAADTIRASLVYLHANPNNFWVAPFGTVAKYIRERNAASVSEISVNEDTITIAVTDTVDNSYYDCPITVRRPLPQGWDSSVVIQNGERITSQEVDVNSVKHVMFDVVPDHGNIALVKSGTTGVDQGTRSLAGSFELSQNYPNPFNPTTTISYSVPRSQHVELTVFDILGNEIASLVKEFTSTGLHTVKFSKGALSSGIYFYRLSAKNVVQVKKLVLLQ